MPDLSPPPVLHLTHPHAHVPGYELPERAAVPLKPWQLLVGILIAVALAIAGFSLEHATHAVDDARVALPWVLPFVLLLGCIATMPFIAPHWWEHHYAKVAIGLGLLVLAYYCGFVNAGAGNIGRSVAEYISFIFLLGSLFVVSGGILIRVRATAPRGGTTWLLRVGAGLGTVRGPGGAAGGRVGGSG
ncbi:MAG: sodium:proton antiporter, partial [Tepidisphaeraceae bacterium]